MAPRDTLISLPVTHPSPFLCLSKASSPAHLKDVHAFFLDYTIARLFLQTQKRKGSQPVETEPNLKISLQHLERRLNETRPGPGRALHPPAEPGQRGAEVARTPDALAQGPTAGSSFLSFPGKLWRVKLAKAQCLSNSLGSTELLFVLRVLLLSD